MLRMRRAGLDRGDDGAGRLAACAPPPGHLRASAAAGVCRRGAAFPGGRRRRGAPRARRNSDDLRRRQRPVVADATVDGGTIFPGAAAAAIRRSPAGPLGHPRRRALQPHRPADRARRADEGGDQHPGAFHPETEPAGNGINTIAEIPGTDLANEVVVMGAHLDSYPYAGGATDNATGSAAMMEAVRVIQGARAEAATDDPDRAVGRRGAGARSDRAPTCAGTSWTPARTPGQAEPGAGPTSTWTTVPAASAASGGRATPARERCSSSGANRSATSAGAPPARAR